MKKQPQQPEQQRSDYSAPSLSGAPTEQKDVYLAFYEAVAECFGDTWQCPCGRAEDWWIDSNADYATREIRAALQTASEPNSQTAVVQDEPEGWVSVKERLPVTEGDVLVFHVLGDNGRSPMAFDVAAYVDGEWIFPWDRGEYNNPPQWVTHWMPIPTPPETK